MLFEFYPLKTVQPIFCIFCFLGLIHQPAWKVQSPPPLHPLFLYLSVRHTQSIFPRAIFIYLVVAFSLLHLPAHNFELPSLFCHVYGIALWDLEIGFQEQEPSRPKRPVVNLLWLSIKGERNMFGDKPVGISEDFGVCPLDFQNQKKTFSLLWRQKSAFIHLFLFYFWPLKLSLTLKKLRCLVHCTFKSTQPA